jgi:hypothetical protein
MRDESVATYLHGHLAGSQSAEGLAHRMLDADTDDDGKAFLGRFIDEIREERTHIESVLGAVEGEEGLVRRGLDAATELVGMAGALASRTSPGRFADYEALAIGVWGKRLLWSALLKLAEVDERFAGLPLAPLSDQAERQEKELLRLRSASILPSLTTS